MVIILKKAPNKYAQKKAEEFMKSFHNQSGAEFYLRQKAEQAKHDGWTEKQFQDHVRKRGYLKTDMDRKIYQSVVKKVKLRESRDDDKKWQRKKEADRKALQKFLKESMKPFTLEDARDFGVDPKVLLNK